jgi:hypothetical protein
MSSTAARGAEPWAEYPLNSPAYQPALYNGAEIREHLESAPTNCFATEGDRNGVSVRIIDVYLDKSGE